MQSKGIQIPRLAEDVLRSGPTTLAQPKRIASSRYQVQLSILTPSKAGGEQTEKDASAAFALTGFPLLS